MHIVCLGCCCSASFRLIRTGLKQENSIVEWMVAIDFKEVLSLFRKLAHGDEESVFVVGSAQDRTRFAFENTDIHTRHYATPADIEARFRRRVVRLRQWIEKGEPVLFVRHDGKIPTTAADLRAFDMLLRSIRVDVAYDFVLFTPPSLYRPLLGMPCRHYALPRDDRDYIKLIFSSHMNNE